MFSENLNNGTTNILCVTMYVPLTVISVISYQIVLSSAGFQPSTVLNYGYPRRQVSMPVWDWIPCFCCFKET